MDEPEELHVVYVRNISSIQHHLRGEEQGRMIEIMLNEVHGGTQVKVVCEVSSVWIDQGPCYYLVDLDLTLEFSQSRTGYH